MSKENISEYKKNTAEGCTDILIKNADKRHIEAIATFNKAMALETESLDLDKDKVIQGVSAVVNNPQLGFYLVAEADGLPVGCLMITNEWSDWRNGLFWWIQSVYVSPQIRGQGVYRQLYQEVLKRALNDGQICGIRLYVERNNTTAQGVYQNLGMTDSGYLLFETELPHS